MWAFKTHDVDGVASDADENKAHGVEVERAPMVLDKHVGVSSSENYQIEFLSFVTDADYVLVSQDLE